MRRCSIWPPSPSNPSHRRLRQPNWRSWARCRKSLTNLVADLGDAVGSRLLYSFEIFTMLLLYPANQVIYILLFMMVWFFLVGLLFGFETFLYHISIPVVNLSQSPPWMLPMYIQWLCVRSWMLKIKTLEIKCWKLLILPIVHIHFPLCDF